MINNNARETNVQNTNGKILCHLNNLNTTAEKQEIIPSIRNLILKESNNGNIQQTNILPLVEDNSYQNEDNYSISCGVCQCLGDIANNCCYFLIWLFD